MQLAFNISMSMDILTDKRVHQWTSDAFFVTQDELKGDPVPPSCSFQCVNLEFVEIQIKKYDDRELGLLGCLLQIAHALKHVKLRPVSEHNSNDYNRFSEKWESLKKTWEQGNMSEKIREFSFQF